MGRSRAGVADICDGIWSRGCTGHHSCAHGAGGTDRGALGKRRDAGPRAAKSQLKLVCGRYKPKASEWVERYEHVALLNGLEFHRVEELCAVGMFDEALRDIVHGWKDDASKHHPLLPPPAEILAGDPAMAEAVRAL